MFLKELTEAVGPSGYETNVRDVIRAQAEPLCERLYTDSLGSLIAHTGSENPGPRVLVAAHMDEIGLLVQRIDERGYLHFLPIGGVDPRILVAKPVLIGPGRVYGVIGAKAVHLQRADERERPLDIDQLTIDIGASSKQEAERLVRPGDFAVFATRYEEIGDGKAKAKAFDDRVGCAILLEAMKQSYPVPVVFAFTVQEEIGLRGAGPVANRVKPDCAIILEGTVCSDVGDTVAHAYGTTQGLGPALTVADSRTIAHRGLLEHAQAVARERGLPFQLRRVVGGGNDAGAIHLAQGGIPCLAISVPTRYIHAPAQIVDLADVRHAADLLIAVLQTLNEGSLATT
jgi:putative aminopeptidase FrvX